MKKNYFWGLAHIDESLEEIDDLLLFLGNQSPMEFDDLQSNLILS